MIVYGLLELPFGRNHLLLSKAPGFVNELVGGWQVSPVLTYSGGLPFNLGYSTNNSQVLSLCLALALSACSAADAGQTSPLPESPVAETNLALLRRQVQNGQAEEALRQLDVLAAKSPLPRGVEILRGLALYNLGRFADADRAYSAALQANPHDEKRLRCGG